jgi:hypothetical protein
MVKENIIWGVKWIGLCQIYRSSFRDCATSVTKNELDRRICELDVPSSSLEDIVDEVDDDVDKWYLPNETSLSRRISCWISEVIFLRFLSGVRTWWEGAAKQVRDLLLLSTEHVI